MPNEPTIHEEAGLDPSKWKIVDSPPIVPGAPPVSATTPVVPQYSQGSLPPNFQHDASFVDTAQPTPNAPKFSLMPLGLSSSSVSSAQITSVVKTSQRLVGNSLLLETDGLQNPNQSILNIVAGHNITASSDASGAVLIAGAPGLFTSRPDFKRWTLWAQNGGTAGISGTGFTSVNDSIINTQSGVAVYTAVPPSSVDDFGLEQKITGTSGNFSAITGSSGIIPARDFSVFCPIRLSTVTGGMRVWVVATDVAAGLGNLANHDVPGFTNIVGFRYSTTVGGNWFAVVANAAFAGQSEIDTGVPINSTVANMLRVDFDSASSTYTFFIDGNQVASISSVNNPSTTAPLLGFVSVACVGGVSVTNAVRYSAFYTEMRTVVTTN